MLSAVILGCVAVVGYSVIPPGQTAARSVLAGVLVILSIPVLVCFRMVLFPYTLELVLDDSAVRWGREDAPDRQRVLRIDQIRRLIHEEGSGRVFAQTSRWRLTSVGNRVLVRFRDRVEFLAAIKESFPEIEVVVRAYQPS